MGHQVGQAVVRIALGLDGQRLVDHGFELRGILRGNAGIFGVGDERRADAGVAEVLAKQRRRQIGEAVASRRSVGRVDGEEQFEAAVADRLLFGCCRLCGVVADGGAGEEFAPFRGALDEDELAVLGGELEGIGVGGGVEDAGDGAEAEHERAVGTARGVRGFRLRARHFNKILLQKRGVGVPELVAFFGDHPLHFGTDTCQIGLPPGLIHFR